MKKKHFSKKRNLIAFTLVELLVVIAIIGLMAGLLQPALATAIKNAQSLKCASNLRSIGAAVSLYATDNDNTLPTINQAAIPPSGVPVYPPSTLGLVGVLGPYGITTNVVQCPADVALGSAAACNNTSYPNPGSSYEWNPVFDDELVNAPAVYVSATTARPVQPSRIRLAMDFASIHHNKKNAVFLDGHVIKH